LLDHTNGITRISAAAALRGFGTNASPAVPVIKGLLESDPEKVNDFMLRLLVGCGPDARRAIPTLRICAENTNPVVSITCSRTLFELEPSQGEFVRPIALKWTTSADTGVRIESATLLWKIDSTPEQVVPILIGLLEDNDDTFDYRTILFLKKIGPDAQAAISALTEWLNRTQTSETFTIDAAKEALQTIRGPK